MKPCIHCREALGNDVDICPGCGGEQEESAAHPSPGGAGTAEEYEGKVPFIDDVVYFGMKIMVVLIAAGLGYAIGGVPGLFIGLALGVAVPLLLA